MTLQALHWNGVDGETGAPLFPPTTSRELAALALGERLDRDHLGELDRWREELEHRRLREGDPGDLAQAGWGCVFASHDRKAPAIREALGELLAHRRAQASAVHEHYYQEYLGSRGYRQGESKAAFLARHGVGPGAADPDRMPYYLLLVGSPELIPFQFQYQLDIQYAVGRIAFDTVEEYAAYARSVVAAETSPPARPRRAVFFAPHHPGDAATELSSDGLAAPLAERLAERRPGWDVATALGAEATKARLAGIVAGEEPAALIFTAGHGLGYPCGHRMQRKLQGSLVCQDFPGFGRWGGPVLPEHYFGADDVGETARVHGLVSFHFACYSAGMPTHNDFMRSPYDTPNQIAKTPFLSRLGQRLLGHPAGGALAVVGHVEHAWQLSIDWSGAGRTVRTIQAFKDAVDRLLAGMPIGYAMEPFSERYAELATDLAEELEVTRYGAKVDEAFVSHLLIGRNDSRNYAVLGDPAVRLAVPPEPGDDGEPDVLRGPVTFGASGG